MTEGNVIVRKNLMTERGYAPYCGAAKCRTMLRAVFNGSQFQCQVCGWISQFPESFIEEYKEKWGIK